MKRTQRKANFKKIQNAQSQGEHNVEDANRRQTRSTKSSSNSKATAGLLADNNALLANQQDATAQVSPPFAKHVNLTRFLYKNKNDIPAEVLKKETDSSDDFETPVKKMKKTAPILSQPVQQSAVITKKPNTRKKPRKRDKQPNIKSALMRSEQMFTEIAAQHCIVDNFNPDEIQMALVISRSEVELDTCNFVNAETAAADDNNLNSENVVERQAIDEDIRAKLQKFGYRTAAKGDYTNCFAAAFTNAQRRGKTKWANKFTALTLRDANLQNKKLNKKIELMLAQQLPNMRTSRTAAQMHIEPYKIRSNFLLKHVALKPDEQFFRNAEYLPTTTEHIARFFIEELFPVTHLPAGHLLKDWTKIPGRDESPQRRKRKRLSAQEKKFEHFYKELEREGMQAEIETATQENVVKNSQNYEMETAAIKNVENVSLLVMPPSQNVCDADENDELDGLLEDIAKVANDVVKNCSSMEAVLGDTTNRLPSPIVISSSGDTIKAENGSSGVITQTRSASPDLFADSESDCDNIVEENNFNDITNFEHFSSDDEKTCLNAQKGTKETLSMKARDVADSSAVDKTVEVEICATVESTNSTDKSMEIDVVKLSSNAEDEDFEMKSPRKENKDLQIEVNDAYNPVVSIDLTQSEDEFCKDNEDGEAEDEDDDDSDCILLSDDEINYSILKAHEVDEHNLKSTTKNSSSARSGSGSFRQANENDHNFSVLEFVQDEACFAFSENGSFSKKQSSFDFNLSGDTEPIKAQYLSMAGDKESPSTTPNKSSKRLIFSEFTKETTSIQENKNNGAEIFSTPAFYTTPTKQNSNINALLKAQRAEFGILESQSEPPFSQTPPTPTPALKSATPLNKYDSPICTADDAAVIAAKRYSNKFASFLQKSLDLGVQPLSDDFEDFDEFDRLVYGSPPKNAATASTSTALSKVDAECGSVPTGLSQLLTGEISFNAPVSSSFSTSTSPICSSSAQNRSPISHKHVEIRTPEKQEEITLNGRVYLVCPARAPKPNFEAQSEAEILKQLYEFGIKPLKRKQAIKILEYIYNETHPIMEAVKPGSSSTITLMAMATQSQSESTLTASNLRLASNAVSVAGESQISTKSSNLTQSTNLNAAAGSNKFNFQDCCGAKLLRYSHELFAELRNDEESYIFQTNITKKTQHPLVPLHIAWFNLVCSNQELHESILMYEPIDLQEVYLFFKRLGYRYDPKDLKSFFDGRCIIFRYDLTAPEKQKDRHMRKTQKKYKTKAKT